MKRLHYACIGAALFACASTAAAQDPVGNVYLALDNLVLNLDGLLDNLAAGDIEGGLQGLGPTVAGLLTDLSQDTALEGLAQTGATLTLQISELGDPVYGIVGSLGTPVVEILAPVLDVYANLGTLDHGLPFINGREIVFFQPAVADALQSATGLPVPIAAELLGSNGTLSQLLGPILAGTGLGLGNGLLGGDGGLLGGSGGGLPLVGDLLGGNLLGGLLGGEGGLLGGLLGGGAGGLPIVGGLLGGGLLSGGIPIVGGLLGGGGGIPIVGGLLGGGLLSGGIPVIGGLLGGEDGGPLLIGDLLNGLFSGGIPIIGSLLGGAAVNGGGQGLALGLIPLPLAQLDPATAVALVNGVTLPGL